MNARTSSSIPRSRRGSSRSRAALRLLAACMALLCAPGTFLAPSPLDAQVRTYRQAEVERAAQETTLTRGWVRSGPRGVEPLREGETTIRLDAGEVLAARSGLTVELNPERIRLPVEPPEDPATSRLPLDQLSLPFRFLVPAADDGELLALRPIYQPRANLRYDPEERVYSGLISLALQDTLQPGRSRELATAVRLVIASGAAQVAPDDFELRHTNLPFHDVEVRALRVTDRLPLRIIPDFDLAGVEVDLVVEPTLTIDRSAPKIAGLGIQSGLVTVAIRGGTLDRPAVVTILPDRGDAEPHAVRLLPGEAETVRIRSAGLGTATIRAFSPELVDAETTIEFGWPVLFLLAALLGGSIGGLAQGLHRSGEGGSRSAARHMSVGTVFGLLAATVYYAVGVNLLAVSIDVDYFNEAAVFALAALAGLLGIPLLGTIRARRDPDPSIAGDNL